MKNSLKSIALILAAGTTGVALFYFANASFTAGFRGDLVVAISASLAIVGFAVRDYSSRGQPLTQPTPLLRPALPANRVAVSATFRFKPSHHHHLAA